MSLEISCRDPECTLAVGEAIGRAARPGLVVGLQGPLGAGKTVFTKGIAKGLGVREWRYVTSPTFAIHNVYRGRLRLHHLDLYRLSDSGELENLGLDDCLYGFDVCVIEWPDLFHGDLPSDRILVFFRWGSSGDRILTMESSGAASDAVLDEIEKSGKVAGFREEAEV